MNINELRRVATEYSDHPKYEHDMILADAVLEMTPIIEAVAEMYPLIDDADGWIKCAFCETDESEPHADDCVWVAARQFLDIEENEEK